MPESYWDGRAMQLWQFVDKAPEAAAIVGFTRVYTDTLLVKFDTHNNYLVMNQPKNGLLAGELVLSRRYQFSNQILASGEVGRDQRLLYDFYDLVSVAWGIVIREQQRLVEEQLLGSHDAILRFTRQRLLEGLGESDRERLCGVLADMALAHSGALDEHKRAMLEQLVSSAQVSDSLGRWNPMAKSARLTSAINELEARSGDLMAIEGINAERAALVVREVKYEAAAVSALLIDALANDRISPDLAAKVLYKPALLSVNNALAQPDEESALRSLTEGLNIFCRLYGPLLYPMRLIAKLSETQMDARWQVLMQLLQDQEALLNLVKLSGDHGLLLSQFAALATGCREAFMARDFGLADEMAERGMHLMRYRVLPGETKAPAEWYLQESA